MRKPVPAAALLMCAVVLSGCNAKRPDYPKQYKDYLDYTFNGNYTAEQKEKEDDRQTWNITYTDKQGNQRTTALTAMLYEPDPEDEYGGSQEKFDNYSIYAFTAAETAALAEEEMFGEIVTKHLPELTYAPNQTTYQTDDYSFYFACIHVPAMQSLADESCYARVERHLTETDDLKIAETDLKAVAQNPEFWIVCNMMISEDADAAAYESAFREIEADFCAAAESPQNCRFLLKQAQPDDTASETLYCARRIFGEPLDDSDFDESEKHAELHLIQSRLAETE